MQSDFQGDAEDIDTTKQTIQTQKFVKSYNQKVSAFNDDVVEDLVDKEDNFGSQDKYKAIANFNLPEDMQQTSGLINNDDDS
jgi:hypothetical protein